MLHRFLYRRDGSLSPGGGRSVTCAAAVLLAMPAWGAQVGEDATAKSTPVALAEELGDVEGSDVGAPRPSEEGTVAPNEIVPDNVSGEVGIDEEASPELASDELKPGIPESVGDVIGGSVNEIIDSMEFYGRLQVRVVMADDEREIQNGSSRLGFRLRRDMNDDLAIVGQVEWQVNLVDDPTVLTPGDSTGSDLTTQRNTQALETRLGWLGFDLGDYGVVSLGKQWSTYYDVAGWTDVFHVFGGAALGVFTAGTDGGLVGTGRAEQAAIWRADYGDVSFGLQTQMKGLNSDETEGYGASLRYQPLDWLQMGVSFNVADIGDGIEIQSDDDPRVITGGVRIHRDQWTVAVSYADQRQSEVVQSSGDLRLVDASGVELYARRSWDEHFGVYGGINWRDAEDTGVDSSADLEQYLLGVDYRWDKRTVVYFQGLVEQEEGGRDAIAAGLIISF